MRDRSFSRTNSDDGDSNSGHDNNGYTLFGITFPSNNTQNETPKYLSGSYSTSPKIGYINKKSSVKKYKNKSIGSTYASKNKKTSYSNTSSKKSSTTSKSKNKKTKSRSRR